MAIRLTEKKGGKILEVRVSGNLTHGDYQCFVPEFGRLVKQHGKINVLFEMVDFRGWKAAALWDDIKFDLKHFADIERLAMVGERKWQKGMSKFCHPFTTARIRYFDRTAASEARAWLAAESDFADVWPAPVLRVFQSRAQTKAFYNKISRFYDALSDRSEAPVRKAGLDLLKPRAGEKILEIGFGTGHTLAVLAKAVGSGGRVFGLDLSDEMVRLGKKNLAEAGLLERDATALWRRGTTSLCREYYGCGVYELHAGTVRHAGDSKGTERMQARAENGRPHRRGRHVEGRRARTPHRRLRMGAQTLSELY